MTPRDPADLRLFATAVDWRAAERDKEQYWCSWKKKSGPAEGIRIADELRRQTLARKADWPTAQDRREDHAAHLRLEAAFDRFDAWRRSVTG